MLQNLPDDLFLSQKLRIKRKYSNKELYLHQYFQKKTKIHPESVFIYKNSIIFFFVKNEDYFKAKLSLRSIRGDLRYKKVLIIRAEQTLIKLLFSFFPDTHIHDILLEFNNKNNQKIITVNFLSFEERGIAVGRNGDYIKSVNEIFQNHVNFKDWFYDDFEIKIQCECTGFQLPRNIF